MRKTGRALLVAGAIWVAGAQAHAPGDLTDADWTAAAQASLAQVERHGRPRIIVLDERLSSDAQQALRSLRETVTPEQLPEPEKYALPPGNYLKIWRFQPDGDRIDFAATKGVVERGMGRSCGQSEQFFLARAGDGAWAITGNTTLSMC